MSSTPDLHRAAARSADAQAIAALRGDMLRFAQLQLRQADAAEDMVQEAIEAALRNRAAFCGDASLKTWVFAILRNKIIDHLRQARRTVAVSDLVAGDDDWQEQADALFDERGHWLPASQPGAWPDPEQALRQRQFWVVFEVCLYQLPKRCGRAFMMREFLGFETDEICRNLEISTANCHVLLHRARLKLRTCLESGWAKEGDRTC